MQAKDGRVYLRLDRVLATNEWVNKFGEVRVNHLVDSTSDHCALFTIPTLLSKLELDASTLRLCGQRGRSARSLLKRCGALEVT